MDTSSNMFDESEEDQQEDRLTAGLGNIGIGRKEASPTSNQVVEDSHMEVSPLQGEKIELGTGYNTVKAARRAA